jgi:hypothetical protein
MALGRPKILANLHNFFRESLRGIARVKTTIFVEIPLDPNISIAGGHRDSFRRDSLTDKYIGEV